MADDALYEIRDYHYDPARMDAYRTWCHEAVAVLDDLVDLVGWWVDDGEVPPRVEGTDPAPSRHGQANVTWVLRWEDMGSRERIWAAMWDDPAWQACWERHPGVDGYLQRTSRFLRRLDQPGG